VNNREEFSLIIINGLNRLQVKTLLLLKLYINLDEANSYFSVATILMEASDQNKKNMVSDSAEACLSD
jgi:hypothetical protein